MNFKFPKNFLTFTLGLLILIYLAGCAKSKIPSGELTAPPPATLEKEKVSKKPSTPPTPKGKVPPAITEKAWFVSVDQLHLRACAGLSCQIIATLQRGEPLFQTGEMGEWIRVRVRVTKQEGWVSSKYVVKDPPSATTAAPSPQETPKLKEEWATLGQEAKPPSQPKETFSPK
jgi:uncharacterized protein YgiM (DUF1202 family)